MKKFSLFFVCVTVLSVASGFTACEILSPDDSSASSELPSGPPEEFILCSEVAEHIGEKDIWVMGYIVGGDLSSSSMSLTPPFRSMTNLAIAHSPFVVEKDSCVSVQLPKGAIRDSLNLVSNPERLWKQVYIKGDIVDAYFGIHGIKNVSEYF